MQVETMCTRYEVSALPESSKHRRHFLIVVEYRGRDQWAVTQNEHWVLGAGGGWDLEMNHRSDGEWLATHRFDLFTALRLAEEKAPHLKCNEWSVRDALEGRIGGRG